jgi:hypothetical protein
MKFTEKNDFIVKNKKVEFFSKDLELFKKSCPNSRLHSDLKRLNSFNRSKLHGLMLVELLDKVDSENILKNREEKPTEILIENIEQAKEILVKMDIDPGKVSEEFLSENIGKPAKDFQSIMEVLKPSLVGENKILTFSVQPEDKDIETVETLDEVKKIVTSEFPKSGYSDQVLEKLVGKTKGDILNFVEFGKLFTSQAEDNEKEQELEEKEEELTYKELELEEKEESLEEKAQELEDKEKELSEKEAELEKTSTKKKEASEKNSRK